VCRQHCHAVLCPRVLQAAEPAGVHSASPLGGAALHRGTWPKAAGNCKPRWASGLVCCQLGVFQKQHVSFMLQTMLQSYCGRFGANVFPLAAVAFCAELGKWEVEKALAKRTGAQSRPATPLSADSARLLRSLEA
jgi:hypothetical protein